jgi:Derlin-2/3
MLQSYSQRYEMEPYNTGAGGGTADYVFALMFGSVVIFASYPLASMLIPTPPIFSRTLMFFVLYTWSKRHPTALTSIWGVQFKAIYLPFATLALEVLMGHLYSDIMHGIAVGHLYYFLVDVVPLVYGKDVLHTPQFLIDRLGVGAYVAPVPTFTSSGGRVGGIGNNTWQAPGRVNQPANPTGPASGHNWGSGGQRLGS